MSPTPSLPAPLARRVLQGELTLDQALLVHQGGEAVEGETKLARVRQQQTRGEDGLNKTERRYRDEVLERLKGSGQIQDYRIPCPIKLRVGPTWKASFEPDAVRIHLDGTLVFVDVKAGMRVKRKDGSVGHRPLSQDDARAKLHAAAVIHPWFRFMVAYPIPKKDGGGWREVTP